jgi:hypothetical protein
MIVVSTFVVVDVPVGVLWTCSGRDEEEEEGEDPVVVCTAAAAATEDVVMVALVDAFRK